MTTTHYIDTPESSEAVAASKRVARCGLGALRITLAFGLGAAGLQKLAGSHEMVHMFATIGVGQWLRYLVGTMEVLGAIGLLIPRLAGLAASAVCALLFGATITNLAVLHTSPALPLVFLAGAATIAFARRADAIQAIRSVRA